MSEAREVGLLGPWGCPAETGEPDAPAPPCTHQAPWSLGLAKCSQGPLAGPTDFSPTWGQIKGCTVCSLGENWLTFEGLLLPKELVNLDLGFCSATMHCSLYFF